MPVNNSLALLVRPPEIDVGGTMLAASQIQRAQSDSALAQMRLRQANRQEGALDAYRMSGNLNDLRGEPDIYSKYSEMMDADRQRKTLRNARSAQSLLSMSEAERQQAWPSMLEKAHRDGDLDGPTYESLKREGPNVLRLQNVVSMASKIPTRLGDAQVQGAQTTNTINAERLAELRDPEITYRRRASAAERYGGTDMTPRERNEFIMTGDFPRAANAQQTPESQADARRRAAIQQGLDASDPHVRQYILTGRFPREDQAPLTATDKKAILEADESVMTNRAVIDALTEAERLNPQVNTGMLASGRATIGNYMPDLLVQP